MAGKRIRISFRAEGFFSSFVCISFFVLQSLLSAEESKGGRKMGDNDKEFKNRVIASARKGIDALLPRQSPDGSWDSDGGSQRIACMTKGVTALCTFTLLKAGTGPSHESVLKGIEYLRKCWIEWDSLKYVMPPAKGSWYTFDAGLTLMAIEAAYKCIEPSEIKIRERKLHAQGRVADPAISIPDMKMMEKVVKFLVQNRGLSSVYDHGAGNPYNLPPTEERIAWSFPEKDAYADRWNTFFAVSGLAAASRCGISVPKNVWEALLQYSLSCQQKDSTEKVQRYSLIEDKKNGNAFFKPLSNTFDRARGWCYTFCDVPKPGGKPGSSATGSMTASAIAIMAQSVFCLKATNNLRKDDSSKSFTAMQDGLAWIDAHYMVRCGQPADMDSDCYHLWIIENACDLVESRNIGVHDWYRDGAEFIMNEQKENGGWSDPTFGNICSTCFAVLFLIKGAN